MPVDFSDLDYYVKRAVEAQGPERYRFSTSGYTELRHLATLDMSSEEKNHLHDQAEVLLGLFGFPKRK